MTLKALFQLKWFCVSMKTGARCCPSWGQRMINLMDEWPKPKSFLFPEPTEIRRELSHLPGMQEGWGVGCIIFGHYILHLAVWCIFSARHCCFFSAIWWAFHVFSSSLKITFLNLSSWIAVFYFSCCPPSLSFVEGWDPRACRICWVLCCPVPPTIDRYFQK